jgi:hypothetical protein
MFRAANEESDRAHILILTHRQDKFEEKEYLLHALAQTWRERGMRVTIQQGPGPRVEADVVIPHVDLTALPREYVDCLQHYPLVLNGRVRDISKRLISKNIVRKGGGYAGPVIVKTNRNCAGAPDATMVRRRRGLGKKLAKLRRHLPWSWQGELSRYPIYTSAAEVPTAVWWNRDLVVERFLPERKDEFYCLRTWCFFGDQEINSIVYSHDPVVKARTIVTGEKLEKAPTELHRMRKELGFDFGKFDYSVVDGEVVLYDANTTPTLTGVPPDLLSNMMRLADGLQTFLPKPAGSLATST